MVTFLIGTVVGAVIGVVVTVALQPSVERCYARVLSMARKLGRRSVASDRDDLSPLGMFQILVWSPGRPLDPELHNVRHDSAERSPQEWFPELVWAEARDRARERVQGVVADVSGYTVDHGEAGPDSRNFVLTVRPSLYADAVAMQELTNSDTYWPAVDERFGALGVRAALGCGPPQSMFVALTLLSDDLRCLALRRASAAVTTSGGLWSLGVCETMGPPPRSPGYAPESLFDLARRAAAEELGLERTDIGPIWFSWFGFSRCDGLLAVAHTRTRLRSHEVNERILGAEGGYEADGVRWIDPRSAEIATLSTPALHDGWLGFTCVVARDQKRLWTILGTEPRRR